MRPFVLACLLPLSAFLLTGCHKIKLAAAALGHRPSAHMPATDVVPVQFVDQNWSQEQRQWFYHAGQGSILVPAKWFFALEQPKLKVFGKPGRFSDPTYLASFGFLSDGNGAKDGLPVGFARETIVDPVSDENVEVIGLTCAACHTGQLNYHGKGLRIDGGTASADLVSFQNELSYAVGLTGKIPFRFDRFARNVLGENASAEDKKKLREEFDRILNDAMVEVKLAQNLALYPVADGFGRTDALARIGNFVFGNEIDTANLRVATAPVKLPPLWYTGWFDRVQYNYSIGQPMTRNIGEALGVRALVNLKDPAKLYQSTVNVPNLWKMEEQLAGPAAFAGLKQPMWPEQVFSRIDHEKAQRGAALYNQRCEQCHLPPLSSPEAQDAQFWVPGLEGKRFLKLKVSSLDEIGTDPHQAADFAQRTAVTGAMGLGTVAAAPGLNTVTVRVRDLAYDKLGLTPKQRIEWNGYRPDSATAALGYRARPMGGIWATPPFLHNGSVPSLYDLLSPADERPKTFYTGRREFDPVRVGYDTSPLENGFLFDTSKTGNSNAGHEYSNKPGKGVLGPELSTDDRWAIIEYMKTIDDSAPKPSTAPTLATATASTKAW